MIAQIKPSFTKNNTLKISITSDILNNKYKICFSLIYTIIEIEGAIIIKQIGRYYELEVLNQIISIRLQTPKTGTYNLSCGPEGLFLINKEDKLVECKIENLKFENKIENVNYSNDLIDDFVPIIPEPLKYSFKKDYVSFKSRLFRLQDEELIKNTKEMASKLGVVFSETRGMPILFKKTDNIEDEYSIIISKENIEIYFDNYGGKFYALMTLFQLIFFYHNKLPVCKIDDKPKFNWRGMHLDCARQFYSIEEIKRLLNYMALFKLNRFHWHLTDNEAWRIEIKQYPNLINLGAFRGYNMKIPSFYGSGYYKYGGFYTQKDVKSLIDYAKKLNIEIMPEIDLPAHSWTLLQIMPELRDQNSNIVSKDIGSYKDNTIDPSIDETSKFLKIMLEEICDIFTFNTIHVGLDERPVNSWTSSPSIKEFMKKNKINSQADFQDYYMNNLIDIMKSKNKRTAAWNEAAVAPYFDHGVGGSAGKIDKSCLVFSWEHSKVAIEATNKNFETVLCPAEKTYFDMAHNNANEERGLCWAATIEARDVFNWIPGDNIKNKNLIKGVQGQLWSETITNKEFFDEMINPRLATLSEIAWKGRSMRSWNSFRSCLFYIAKMLNKFGWKHHLF